MADVEAEVIHQKRTRCVTFIFVFTFLFSGGVLAFKIFGGGQAADELGTKLIANFDDGTELPTTKEDATKQGWTMLDANCSEPYGYRMQKGKSIAPILMFDAHGDIAGMQFNADTKHFPAYPETNLQQKFGALQTQEGRWGLVVWFRSSSHVKKICEKKDDTDRATNIGEGLWLQMDKEATEFESFPYEEFESTLSDLNFTRGGCVKSGEYANNPRGMGTTWYRHLEAKTCTQVGPMALLYSDNRLQGFSMLWIASNEELPTIDGADLASKVTESNKFSGWKAANADDLWEFPVSKPDNKLPACLNNLNSFDDSKDNGRVTASMMHVYFSEATNLNCTEAKVKMFFK